MLFRIALFEYRRNVFKRSFLLALLSVPAMVVLVLGVGIVMESRGVDNAPVGYVDHVGLLARRIAPPVAGTGKLVEFVAFETEEAARAALDAAKIQAYFVLSADYYRTRDVDLVYIHPPGNNAMRQFYDFVRINLLAGQSPAPALARRALLVGDNVTVTSLDGRRHIPSGGPTFGLLMPLLIGLAFLLLVLMSSGYLLQAVVEEKENRTMEVLVTSVSPLKLVAGKVVGTVGVSFTQLLAWILISFLALALARLAGINWLHDLSLDWGPVLATAALAIPGFVLVSALMVAVGAAVTSGQESQAVGTFFSILHALPLWLAWAIVSAPHSTLSATLTFMPFTALLTLVLRNLFSTVPAWQVGVSIAVQTVCALAAVWLAGHVFRLGMLRYGRRLGWQELVRARVK
jgi:ABC-2 type transport system permease protein